MVASESVTDLSHIKRFYRADAGVSGADNGKYGMKGQHLKILVPHGTVIFRHDERGKLCKIGDCDSEGSELLVAKGGKGGRGNRSLRTNNQTHESGLPGESVKLRLDLNTIAEIGLVGLPNAGKSSLLSSLSRCNPAVAPYPFTTITPNVGIIDLGSDLRLSMADIPGLIDGAHKNVGLGHAFLKHVVKNRQLALVLDVSQSNPIQDAHIIIQELELYQQHLSKKIAFIIANKIDRLEAGNPVLSALQAAFPQTTIIPISAKYSQGIDKLKYELMHSLNKVLV